MIKNKVLFDEWSLKKYEIESISTSSRYIVKNRQIWLFYVGVNIGNEESKDYTFVRPGLILNNFLQGDLVLIIPLTSKYNKNLKNLYYKIEGLKYGLKSDSYILLNQFKVISKKRLIRKLNDKKNIPLLNNNEFINIIKLLKSFI